MLKKIIDNTNERIGIITIAIVILASILSLLYFLGFFTHKPVVINPKVPIEAPHPKDALINKAAN